MSQRPLIYLDNAATTKPFDGVADILTECNSSLYFNPSAPYSAALEVQKRLSRARAAIAEGIGAEQDEIFFTASATEANNTVFKCGRKNKKLPIVISAGEHASVYNAAIAEKERGAEVIVLPLGADGRVDACDCAQSKPDLVSIIHLSNETGAVNDIAKIASGIRQKWGSSVLIHSDGVQAVGKLRVNVRQLGVDFYSFSAHKLHGCKGIAALYIRKGVRIPPLIVGGGQESGMRSGTENVGGILSFEYAMTRKLSQMCAGEVEKKRDEFLRALDSLTDGRIRLNVSGGSPYIMSLACRGVRAEILMRALDSRGVVVGIGSACAGKQSNNRVLAALGIDKKSQEGTIRVSIDEYTDTNSLVDAARILAQEYGKMVEGV